MHALLPSEPTARVAVAGARVATLAVGCSSRACRKCVSVLYNVLFL